MWDCSFNRHISLHCSNTKRTITFSPLFYTWCTAQGHRWLKAGFNQQKSLIAWWFINTNVLILPHYFSIYLETEYQLSIKVLKMLNLPSIHADLGEWDPESERENRVREEEKERGGGVVEKKHGYKRLEVQLKRGSAEQDKEGKRKWSHGMNSLFLPRAGAEGSPCVRENTVHSGQEEGVVLKKQKYL